MPLPANGTPWPPLPPSITTAMAAWSAWYDGSQEALTRAYSGTSPAAFDRTSLNRPSQYRGGLVGNLARFFWGRPTTDLTKPRHKLHVPVAADLCQASADLLFSEPPTLTVEDTATQDRLNVLAGDGMHTTLAEAAEVGAALGGVYLRTTWDRDVADAPFLTTVHADAAVPEFRWGRLAAVTFWRVVKHDDGDRVVLRHLERHELDAAGVGVILHGLYEGTRESLGRLVPLTEHPAAAPFAKLVDAQGLISTESPGLAVGYVPNQRPQRRWRSDPVGAHLGRSDLDGVEPLMDALDETYSSWMRDIRLAKARAFVAESLLENLGRGQGSAFDDEQEIFAPVNALPPREASGLPIEFHQAAIRFEEHRATAQQLLEDILRTAGYSAQTFGEGPEGAVTATEVRSRERRSFMTRDRKVRLWRPAITERVEKLLAVDRAVFGTEITPGRPDVAFGDSVQDDPVSLATSAELLRRAQAASTQTLVRMLHPDWDDQAVQDEAGQILAEQGMAVPDPDTRTGLPAAGAPA